MKWLSTRLTALTNVYQLLAIRKIVAEVSCKRLGKSLENISDGQHKAFTVNVLCLSFHSCLGPSMMFAISSAISSLRLHVVRKSYKTISHHYCGCCMAVGWTLFWKKKSLGFVRLPQGLRTKSWNRLATISSQTSFLTCLLLGLKTAARQTHDDFSCWHPWWTCQLINTVKRGPYGSCTIASLFSSF